MNLLRWFGNRWVIQRSLNAGVNVAHVMEDCFVLAQQDKLRLRRRQIDALFKGVDLLMRIANAPGDD